MTQGALAQDIRPLLQSCNTALLRPLSGLPATPPAGPRNSMTAAAKRLVRRQKRKNWENLWLFLERERLLIKKETESLFAVFDPRVAFQNITGIDSTLYCSAVKRLSLYHRHFGAPVPVFKRFGG